MNFSKLNLNNEIIDVLYKLGFQYPTEVQQKAIPVVLSGRDAIIRSETGSGKTFAFVLPIVQQIDVNADNVQALIVCPTRELAIQVADETKKIAEPFNIKVCAVFGGSNIARQVDSLKKRPQTVVGTTGRIIDLINKKALKIERASFIVLDEADEMLDMGFRPDIEKIFYHADKNRQTLLFSATIPNEIKQLATRFTNDATIVEIGKENKAINTIKQSYIFVDKKNKKQALLELFFSDIYQKSIIFVNTKAYAEDLEHLFKKNKIIAKALHGDLRQSERRRILDAYKQGDFYILIATDVASRGLDIKNIDYIVNFDLPHELEYYVHRIGRTARAGASGQVINLITSLEQFSKMRDIEKATNATITLYETESENLKQYFVDTKKLAKISNRYATYNGNFLYNGRAGGKENGANKPINIQNKFRRFSTFDNFDEYYGEKKCRLKNNFKKNNKKNNKKRQNKYK